MQKCEKMPQIAMTTAQPQIAGDGQLQTSRVGTSPAIDCTTSIQKIIASVFSVRVSDLTSATEIPKPTAATSAINWPGSTSPVAGRMITTTPINPSTIAVTLLDVMRSLRKMAARIAAQITMVNSIVTTWPIGISVSA